jgi:hypothetical protein
MNHKHGDQRLQPRWWHKHDDYTNTPSAATLNTPTSPTARPATPSFDDELGLNHPESEKTLEEPTSKTQKVIAQVKRAVPGLMARDYGFFSTETSLV